MAQAHYAIDGGFLHRLGPQLIAAFERASVAWHGLFGWASVGSKARAHVKTEEGCVTPGKHGRHASQQLEPARVKRERVQADAVRDRVAIALQRIYGPGGKPQSEEQASALRFVHDPPKTSIIVLPTSSGKSVLFYPQIVVEGRAGSGLWANKNPSPKVSRAPSAGCILGRQRVFGFWYICAVEAVKIGNIYTSAIPTLTPVSEPPNSHASMLLGLRYCCGQLGLCD